MKKRILIVSELFYPMNVIGANRPTKLAKYLAQENYEVHIFTAAGRMSRAEAEKNNFNVVSELKDEGVSATMQSVSGVTKFAARIKKRGKVLTELSMAYRQWLYCKNGKRLLTDFRNAVESGKIVLQEYDCLFTTFGPVGSLLVGLEAKKQMPQLRWICDFRDPMVSQAMPKTFVPYYSYLQRKSVRLSEYVTTVSDGYCKRIMLADNQDKFRVIPNGYDDADRPDLSKMEVDDKFSFAYVGSLYEGKRDLSKVFKVLREMIDCEKISQEKVVFHYAGGEGHILRSQAKMYDLDTIVEDHGQMSRADCLNLQASVRFLVLSTWNDKGEEGVFPGKLIEYMLLRKPVISVVGGKLPNCEVTRVIRELKLGVSYEEAQNSTWQEMRNWLIQQCEAYNEGKPPAFSPIIEEIEKRYNWKNIVRRFGELIEG